MEKIVEQGLLYDCYGALLTEHQRQIYEDAVFGDLSLAELSAQHGISRQGIHDLLRRCDRTLREYENRLHLLERTSAIRSRLKQIDAVTTQDAVRALTREIWEEL